MVLTLPMRLAMLDATRMEMALMMEVTKKRVPIRPSETLNRDLK